MIGVSGAVGAVGALGFALLRDYVAVFVVGAVAFGIGGVCFSQLFAYTKELAQERGRPVTAFMSVVRAVFSAAWVIGPPIGLFVFARFGFGPLYLATAGLSLVTAVLGRWFLPRVPVPPPQVAASRRRLALPARTWLLLCAVVALGVVNQMYNIDIALYVTKDLRLGTQLIGWMAGAGAALEIPVMIVCGRFADRIGKLRLVLAATAAATVFFCLLPLARTAVALLALQLLNAAWVAVAMSIPMVMVQEEAPGGAGAASSLYGSAFTIAALLAGAVTGVTTTAVGYGNVFWVCAALSAVSGGLLLARVRRG